MPLLFGMTVVPGFYGISFLKGGKSGCDTNHIGGVFQVNECECQRQKKQQKTREFIHACMLQDKSFPKEKTQCDIYDPDS